jgi:ribosome maturation factor RimP
VKTTTEVGTVSTGEGQLWSRIEDYLGAESLELDDLVVAGGGRGKVIKVIVDGERVDVDRLAAVSRGLSRMLDADDPIDGSYTLEVSSPGLERSLRRPNHYAKSVGRLVNVKTTHEIDGTSAHKGTILAAEEDEFVLDVAGSRRTIRYEDVAKARTVFEWGPRPKPGKKSG